ncbi:MAG: DUF2236 domain-containing protein [Solirubrobacteraceae bacterium]|nr:DUF2236 domain-containing protein [Solirubrobacteraceae bacterium]
MATTTLPRTGRFTREGDAPAGAPLGPGSLTWKHFGDTRGLLFAARTGGWLQNLHPAVGWMLQEHTDTFSNPWDRIFRSLPMINAVIYDEPVEQVFGEYEAERVSTARGRRIRDFHKNLNVKDVEGRTWHALQPDVFYWTHATFVEAIVATQDLFGTPLTLAEKDQLIAESVTWWRRYGMADIDGMPTDWASFDAYWNDILESVLERNPTSDFTNDVHLLKISSPPGLPTPLWVLVRPAVMKTYRWMSVGMSPPRVRELQELEWTARDERLFKLACRAVGAAWNVLPESLQYQPNALQARRRKRVADDRRAAAA